MTVGCGGSSSPSTPTTGATPADNGGTTGTGATGTGTAGDGTTAGCGTSGGGAPTPNPPPAVAPALHQWTPDSGTFCLNADSRIVVASADAAALFADALTFREDLAAIIGRQLPVTVATGPRAGDIALERGATGLEKAGYQLDIGDAVVIRGADADGAFYGQQTVEQLFKLATTLPRGSARDWPDYQHRGFMIDAGRHYYEPGDIERQIRTAAWHKLNVLHLHLTDWLAFRLQSDTYPGLADAQSYSHADIARFVELAHRYHVTLVPEIDLPAHASPITAYDPSLRWDCDIMNIDPWGEHPGFVLDVTKPAALTFATNLVREFVPLFKYSPILHLGGDEYPYFEQQQQCPELVAYASAHGFASTEDVMVDWINKVAAEVTRLGRQPEIWNWWDNAGGATLTPSPNLIINAWTGAPDAYLAAGYEAVSSPWTQLYVTPKHTPGGVAPGASHPDNQFLYESWRPPTHPRLRGFEISRWSDDTVGLSDAYLNWFGERPDSVLAAVTWGGPRQASLFAYEDQLDQIGAPPGLPEVIPTGARRLSGTPYGSGPAGGDGSATFDKAFDGNVATFVDLAQADGGYVGIDLGADGASPVVAVRFVPRDAQTPNTLRMVGGGFQGCLGGPATDCHDLAKVEWRPPYDWMKLPVRDARAYRWLRYVGPADSFTNVAEIQFYGPVHSLPRSTGARP